MALPNLPRRMRRLPGKPDATLPARALATMLVAVVTISPCGWSASAEPADPSEGLRWEQRPGAELPADARFLDASGNVVELGKLLAERPGVVVFLYHECPMLCSLVLEGLMRALVTLDLDVGEDFSVVAISIDPDETPRDSRRQLEQCRRRYDREGVSGGWHFLTGNEENIAAAAAAAGFRYRRDEASQTWAHPAGILVTTPGGRVSRHLLGVEFAPRDLRLSIVEASRGSIGSPVDDLLLLCLEWDPTTGKYGLAILRVLRIAGVATVLALALLVWRLSARHRRRTPPIARQRTTSNEPDSWRLP